MEHLFLMCPLCQCVWEVILDAFGIRTQPMQLSDCWADWRAQ